jgi:hypothetical protein
MPLKREALLSTATPAEPAPRRLEELPRAERQGYVHDGAPPEPKSRAAAEVRAAADTRYGGGFVQPNS